MHELSKCKIDLLCSQQGFNIFSCRHIFPNRLMCLDVKILFNGVIKTRQGRVSDQPSDLSGSDLPFFTTVFIVLNIRLQLIKTEGNKNGIERFLMKILVQALLDGKTRTNSTHKIYNRKFQPAKPETSRWEKKEDSWGHGI